MTDRKPAPARRDGGGAADAARERRLAEALRANLGRRKAQARIREEPPKDKD